MKIKDNTKTAQNMVSKNGGNMFRFTHSLIG